MIERKERGQGLVEFAILAPFLLLVLIGIMEMGRVFIVALEVQSVTDDVAVAAARWGGYTQELEDIVPQSLPLFDPDAYTYQVYTLDNSTSTPVCTTGQCTCDYGQIVQVVGQYGDAVTILFWHRPITITVDYRRVCWRETE